MNGLWKEELSGYNHKDSRRKKQSRKNTLRDKSRAILQDFYHPERNAKNFTRTENEQTLTYTGSRWIDVPLPKYADIYKIGFRIPLKGDEYNLAKGTFTRIKAFYLGHNLWDGTWYEASTGKSIRDYCELSFTQDMLINYRYVIKEEKHGKKLLDWTEELEKRKKVTVRDFTHSTRREFVYGKPLQNYLKWSMYTESNRRKFAHKYIMGRTRNSVKTWISNGDWDAERVIPDGEKSYAWIIS